MGDLEIIPRSGWNALEFNEKDAKLLHPEKIIVHHTEMKRSIQDGKRGVLIIQEYHKKERGYRDIAYHYLIDSKGKIYEGAPIKFMIENDGRIYSKAPPEFLKNNSRYNKSIEICLFGDFDLEQPTKEQIDSLKKLLIETSKNTKYLKKKSMAIETFPNHIG